MPADFHRLRYGVPKRSYRDYRTLMHNLETALGFGASEKAQFKLHVIELLAEVGWRGVKKAFPHLSKATVYRWRQQFVTSGRRLNALVPHSIRPKTVRQMEVPSEVLSFLKAMRRKHPHLSKYKLKVFLDEFSKAQGLPSCSVSWIGKVLSRYQLFFETRKPVRKRRKKSRSGYTVKRTPNPDKVTLGYLELDGTTVYWGGEKLVFLTALELKTRTAYAKLVPTDSSFHARAFFLEIVNGLPYSLHTIHTDNGSEFHALFDQVVKELNLTHLWSPSRTPKVHSHIERFNGVIQDEFINYHGDEAVVDQEAFVSRLNDWLNWYNQKRPHHSLNLRSPAQQYRYLLDLEKGEQSLKVCDQDSTIVFIYL